MNFLIAIFGYKALEYSPGEGDADADDDPILNQGTVIQAATCLRRTIYNTHIYWSNNLFILPILYSYRVDSKV